MKKYITIIAVFIMGFITAVVVYNNIPAANADSCYVDSNGLNNLYEAIFHRLPDSGAYGYIGYSYPYVIGQLTESPEFNYYSSIYSSAKQVENDFRNNNTSSSIIGSDYSSLSQAVQNLEKWANPYINATAIYNNSYISVNQNSVVSVSTNSPSSILLEPGEYNTPIGSVTFTNNGSFSVTINEIAFNITGSNSDNSINMMRLYNSQNYQLEEINQAGGEVIFRNVNMTIPANSSVTFNIEADINTNTNGQTVGFTVAYATMTNSNITVSNTPDVLLSPLIIGYQNSGGSDSVILGNNSASNGSVNPGTTNYTVWEATVDVIGNDPVYLSQIGFDYSSNGTSFSNMFNGNSRLYVDENLETEQYSTLFFSFQQNQVVLQPGIHTIKLTEDITGGNLGDYSYFYMYPDNMILYDQYNLLPITPSNSSSINQGGYIYIN